MANTTNKISKIKLAENAIYEIHDAQAIHSVEELGLSAALVFKGTKTKEGEITGLTSAKVGDVWLCTQNNIEYICVKAVSGTANAAAWEKLGNIHDAASTTHTHTVTVTGTNKESVVSGTVIIPKVAKGTKYIKANATKGTVNTNTKTALGIGTTFTTTVTPTTTNIKATASGVAVGANGTTNAITALGSPTVKSALGADATFKVSGGKVQTSKMVTGSASKVKDTGDKNDGTAASWSASVSDDGVLSFNWSANIPTSVTLPTFDSVTVATGSLAETGTGSAVAVGIDAI
jgi:hypothetical protein